MYAYIRGWYQKTNKRIRDHRCHVTVRSVVWMGTSSDRLLLGRPQLRDKPTWRPERCLWEESEAFLHLRKEGIIRRKSDIKQVGWKGNQQRLMTETLWEPWRKSPKQQWVTSPATSAEPKVSRATIRRRLQEQNSRGHTTRHIPLISVKSSWWEVLKPRWRKGQSGEKDSDGDGEDHLTCWRVHRMNKQNSAKIYIIETQNLNTLFQ